MRTVATAITALLLASFALAQTTPTQADSGARPAVAAARCQYSPTDSNCNTNAPPPRRFPGPRPPSVCCPGPRPAVAYAPRPVPSARHVVIGALVGFAVGTVVPKDGSARARLSVGLVGAMFGALIGASIPSYPSCHRQRNRWPDEDDEQDDIANHQPHTPSPSVSPAKLTANAPEPKDSSLSVPLLSEPQTPVLASDK